MVCSFHRSSPTVPSPQSLAGSQHPSTLSSVQSGLQAQSMESLQEKICSEIQVVTSALPPPYNLYVLDRGLSLHQKVPT
ncbi:hypothetical protein SLA2020_214090 [Shorea laevis]